MNKYTKASFDGIKKASKRYENEVTQALAEYHKKMDRAEEEKRVFKDEAEYMRAAHEKAAAVAAGAISAAETGFVTDVQVEVNSLKSELSKHFSAVPSEKFTNMLNFYDKFSLKPSRIEVDTLLECAGGSPLALKALDAVLERNHSEFRVEYEDPTQYERDLEELQLLSEGHLMWAPVELHGDLAKIYKGQPKQIRAQDGRWVDGYTWDTVALVTATSSFNAQVKNLDDKASRWSNTVVPRVFRAKTYGADDSGVEAFVTDYKNTQETAATIEKTAAGAERARALASGSPPFGAVLAQYGAKDVGKGDYYVAKDSETT